MQRQGRLISCTVPSSQFPARTSVLFQPWEIVMDICWHWAPSQLSALASHCLPPPSTVLVRHKIREPCPPIMEAKGVSEGFPCPSSSSPCPSETKASTPDLSPSSQSSSQDFETRWERQLTCSPQPHSLTAKNLSATSCSLSRPSSPNFLWVLGISQVFFFI